jgi:phosphoribosylformylglycinamidine synthase I
MNQPRVLILQETGTNRDPDASQAVELAGGRPEVLHINQLRAQPGRLQEYQMLILPGGFSYGDALGAGRLLAADLRWLFEEELGRFVEAEKPVLGICNGFQALVKSGWLPGPPGDGVKATLAGNASNRFECRWVWLEATPNSPCVFTRGLTERIVCPVAHGEGRFVPRDDAALAELENNGLVVLKYVRAGGGEAAYPDNPNGSTAGVAGICNRQGNVLGLMPHPEDHIFPWQHPRWTRGRTDGCGLALFEQGMRYAVSV